MFPVGEAGLEGIVREDGRWSIRLTPQPAGTSGNITFEGTSSVLQRYTLYNVSFVKEPLLHKVRAVSTRILGNTVRDAVRNKER